MAYATRLGSRAQRRLDKLTEPLAARILRAILSLANDPRPPGCRKLRDRPEWRIRVGDLRVFYLIDDQAESVLVTDIDSRDQAYKKR